MLPPRLPWTWLAIRRGNLQQYLFLDLFVVTNRGIMPREVYKDALNQRIYPFSVTYHHRGVEVGIRRHHF